MVFRFSEQIKKHSLFWVHPRPNILEFKCLFKKLFFETKFLVQPEINRTCESSYSKGQEVKLAEDVTTDSYRLRQAGVVMLLLLLL